MKKMTFALACASTAVLFAALPNEMTFEAYASGFTGLSGYTDDGQNQSATESFWLYMGSSGATDGSTVKAYGGENLAAPTVGDAPGSNYLELSTENGTLWRSVNTLASAEALGNAEPVPESGLYIDTMVQFTPTEDSEGPAVTDADKLAIWLAVKDNTTNLCVRALQAKEGLSANTVETFDLNSDAGNLVVNAGSWYRLTVKANSLMGLVTGYQIFIDGVPLKAVGGKKPFDQTSTDTFQETPIYEEILKDRVFVSLRGLDEGGSTLQAVGFKGSGAIDNLKVSAENPLPEPADEINFTITAADGVTVEWSKDGGSTWTTYAEGAKAPAGDIQIRLTTADGGVKVVSKTLAGASNAFDVSAEAFGWAEYLGAAIDGAYVIDDEAELNKFAAKYQTLGTANETFKLGADISLTAKWAGIGTFGSETDVFAGTFDGAGHKIANVVMADTSPNSDPESLSNTYRGFFNQLTGGTVKNLTVESSGFGTEDLPASKYGSAAIVGSAKNAVIENCVSEGTVVSSTHNVAGIVVRGDSLTIRGCTNKANITGNYTKVAGIVVICKGEGACLIENCVNQGTITAANDSQAGKDGVAGIIAYVDAPVTIKECSNTGVIAVESSASTEAKPGQMIGHVNSRFKAFEGTIRGTTATRMVYTSDRVISRHAATVADGVATFIEDSEIQVGGSYMVMATGLTVTLANVGDSITLDTTLAEATVGTSAENAQVKKEGNVYTVTAAGKDYPQYIIDTDDDETKAKFDAWVEAYGVADRVDANATLKDAYLLNVAPNAGAVDSAKAEFKIKSITLNERGDVVIVGPEGNFNGKVEIKGSETLDGEYILPQDEKKAHFFKAFLSL